MLKQEKYKELYDHAIVLYNKLKSELQKGCKRNKTKRNKHKSNKTKLNKKSY